MSNILKDERFVDIFRDPKFRNPRKNERKVQIDKRFRSMFKSKAFKVKYSVDKRGRKISRNTSEDFKRFYDLPSDEDSDSSSSFERESDFRLSEEGIDSDEDEKLPELSREENDSLEKNRITAKIRAKLKDLKVDYARGEGRLFSDSSSDESESEESDSNEVYHEWNEMDKDADVTHNVTNRLAVCNMDWDRVRALDLMVLFNSFLPSNALIRSVIIYPSDFGLKRMAAEELNGPAELVINSNETVDEGSDSSEDDNDELHMERMRQYQLNRLKYYYAVATFDKPETADYIYANCNGIEYESSGIRLDLRFIDDDTTFDQEPKDSCDSLEKCQKYEPNFFTSTALQQAKVHLTWDETDPRRLQFTRKIAEVAKTTDINDSDLENYVALSSSDEDEEECEEAVFEDTLSNSNSTNECESADEEKDPIEQYRNLMKEIEENEKCDASDAELEITWGADGDEASKIKISKNVKDAEKDDTPFECLLRKRREKSKIKRKKKLQDQNDDIDQGENDENSKNKKLNAKKNSKPVLSEEDEQRKKELELLLIDNDDDNKHHFSLKKLQENNKEKKKKRLKKKETKFVNDDFQVDVNDERFSALYTSHLFNIDPTNPKFLKTDGMNAFVEEKQRRISGKSLPESNEGHNDEPESKKRKDNELSFLVKSVKNKTLSMLPKETSKR